MNKTLKLLIVLVVVAGVFLAGWHCFRYFRENQILKAVIGRLEADSRIAEVVVTGVNYDPVSKKNLTTIKFLEYDTTGSALEPHYFTFPGNIIQFQSLVIRFNDIHIRQADKLKGKSAYLFWKVFALDGKNTQEYQIATLNEVPLGYRVDKATTLFEQKLWRKFWRYALDSRAAGKVGIKNAQIEAPGTIFIPGVIYTLRIEHDGGIRIDSSPIPQILNGENLPGR